MTGMPSRTEPRMMNAKSDTVMNVTAPPGNDFIDSANAVENPDCVSAQAMPVAAPMMNRMEPESAAVPINIGYTRFQSNFL